MFVGRGGNFDECLYQCRGGTFDEGNVEDGEVVVHKLEQVDLHRQRVVKLSLGSPTVNIFY